MLWADRDRTKLKSRCLITSVSMNKDSTIWTPLSSGCTSIDSLNSWNKMSGNCSSRLKSQKPASSGTCGGQSRFWTDWFLTKFFLTKAVNQQNVPSLVSFQHSRDKALCPQLGSSTAGRLRGWICSSRGALGTAWWEGRRAMRKSQ